MILPEQWPTYYSRANGATVWDLNERPYLDFYLMGVGANTLGYACPDIDRKVVECIKKGSMCTLNSYEEVMLAKKLLDLHDWADMARFGKTGGDACAMAVRIARAYSKKDLVLICGYHGCQDWYLAANLAGADELSAVHLSGLNPIGIPRGLAGTVRAFHYNKLQEFDALCSEYGDSIGAVIMEPIRDGEPEAGFLESVREWTEKHDVPLIFDEISLGFRICPGGSHLVLGVNPDMAVFGKAMSNGYPISAVIGRGDIMSYAQETFLSSTFWTERIGFTAANAVCDIYMGRPIVQELDEVGRRVRDIWTRAAENAELGISIAGLNPICHFKIISDNDHERAWMTYFTQTMLEKGFLAAGAFYASTAHDTNGQIDKYESACNEAFIDIARNMARGVSPKQLLKGPVAHQKFERLT